MKLVLTVDTEGDFWKYIQNPFDSRSIIYQLKWHLNKIRGRFIYPKHRKGLENIINFLNKNKIPATFNITGHLYLKACDKESHNKGLRPRATWFFKKDWYYWDPHSNYKKYPGLYLGDFIEKKMKNNPLFDLGIHGFAHECWPLENEDIINKGINASFEASHKLGIKPLSGSSPFNITEDFSNPSVLYKSLKKNGIKIFRYAGKEDFPRKTSHEFKVMPPFEKNGLKLVHVSNNFDGNSPILKIKEIIKDIEEKAKIKRKDDVYCLGCHDFTFKSIKNLQLIFNKVLELRDQGKIELINLSNLI